MFCCCTWNSRKGSRKLQRTIRFIVFPYTGRYSVFEMLRWFLDFPFSSWGGEKGEKNTFFGKCFKSFFGRREREVCSSDNRQPIICTQIIWEGGKNIALFFLACSFFARLAFNLLLTNSVFYRLLIFLRETGARISLKILRCRTVFFCIIHFASLRYLAFSFTALVSLREFERWA